MKSRGERGKDSEARPWVSRLDPRVKILSVLSLLVFIVFAKSSFSFLILGLSLVLLSLLCRYSPALALKALKPLCWLVAATFLANLFLTPGKVLAHFFGFSLTYEGLWKGGDLSLRLFFMVWIGQILLLTTPPQELTGGLLRLLSPLKLLRIPIAEIGTVSHLALSLIPTLREEAHRVLSAQRARGGFERAGLGSVKGMFALVLPLLSSCMERGESLGRALESRACRPEATTRDRRLSSGDYLALATVWLLGFASIWMGLGPGKS